MSNGITTGDVIICSCGAKVKGKYHTDNSELKEEGFVMFWCETCKKEVVKTERHERSQVIR